MSRLAIDFAPRRRVPPALRWLAAALALAMGLASTHAYLDYREADDAWEKAVAEQALAAHEPEQEAHAGQEDDTAAQLRQLRAIHARLDVAWMPLFETVETLHRNEVAMLSMNADAATGALAIEAEARDSQAMQAYLAALGTGGYLTRVHLVSQLRGAQLAGAGVRFAALAGWPALPRAAAGQAGATAGGAP
jgi:Tfp pilus assembly protein PilN